MIIALISPKAFEVLTKRIIPLESARPGARSSQEQLMTDTPDNLERAPLALLIPYRRYYVKHLRLLIFATATLFGGAHAQGFQAYTFEDIKWLSAPDVVVSKLEAAGYTVDDPAPGEADTLTFSGSLLGNAVSGVAMFGDQNQLLKVDLLVPTGGEEGAVNLTETEATYTQIRDAFSERYGPPSREESTATGWFTEEIRDYVGGILVSITGDADVVVAYESPRWLFLLAQRQVEGADVF
jgi:hypothetical protein